MNKRIKIASYRRTLASNTTRMFENVFDWEHLPHLHPTSFTSVQCTHKGRKSLICDVGLWPKSFGLSQRIQVYACQQKGTWVVTVKKGFMRGLSIHTRIIENHGNYFKIQVDFFVPTLHFYWFIMGPLLWLSYSKIYDEDESMMKIRQNQLDRVTQATGVHESSRKFLGYYSQILLKLPLFFDLNDHTYGITLHRDKLLAYDGICPHMLRPLQDVKVENGKIRCPWHGYEFSIENRSCSNRFFSLKPAPNIHIIDDKVFAAF